MTGGEKKIAETELPDRMIEHDGCGLIVTDPGEGEPFDLSVSDDDGSDPQG